jgi:hypothetical protein
MDVHELRIAMEWTKRLERENVDLDTKLHSQANDLREFIKTLKRRQLNI